MYLYQISRKFNKNGHEESKYPAKNCNFGQKCMVFFLVSAVLAQPAFPNTFCTSGTAGGSFSPNYSVLKLFTGFASAAFTV